MINLAATDAVTVAEKFSQILFFMAAKSTSIKAS